MPPRGSFSLVFLTTNNVREKFEMALAFPFPGEEGGLTLHTLGLKSPSTSA